MILQTEKHSKSFQDFNLPNYIRKPAAACTGASVCIKIKLKNFYDVKPTAGCDVAPFSSLWGCCCTCALLCG
ncbi:hypothetical protein PZBJ_13815 [Pantoea endophytica]|uniref:Uncharacterized protein n=1 Tax=Pantoea endophytica TaxID=92488 RepID=A0ABX4SPR7_9GAMM|nr:hypothetical protein PZBJ_13815 [Pantoea endophytica]